MGLVEVREMGDGEEWKEVLFTKFLVGLVQKPCSSLSACKPNPARVRETNKIFLIVQATTFINAW